ncbi:unnamed protein product [Rhizophagus irregularis]|nr:unnamed protein product [Rhizophagus irregularis]
MDVVLKSLENVESANQSWFEEAISHLTIKEQEAFHSKSYCFNIPYNIDDFNNWVLEDNSKSNLSKELQINDIQNNYNREEILSQRMMGHHIKIDDDEDEIYNNPNFHSEEQDEFNIPDDL